MNKLIINPETPPISEDTKVVVSPKEQQSKFKAFFHRPIFWLIILCLIIVAVAFGYKKLFGKAKVVYTTAAVQQGDVENTVLAAGIIQPIKYVDVGAQTSGRLKSLKVKRGDMVKKSQLLAEIDPVLSQTALRSSNATLENMTSQRSVKEAQLVLTKLQRDRNDKLFAKKLIAANDRDITKAAYDVAFAEVSAVCASTGSISASNWPFSTRSPRITFRDFSLPEVWAPTSTYLMGCTKPAASTVFSTSPRSVGAVV